MPPTFGEQSPSSPLVVSQPLAAAKPSMGIRLMKALFIVMICLGVLAIGGVYSLLLLPGDTGLILLIFAGFGALVPLGEVALVAGIAGLVSTIFLRGRWRIFVNLAIVAAAFCLMGINLYRNFYLPEQANLNIPTGLFGPTATTIPPGFHKNSQSGGWSNSLTDAGYDWSYSNATAQQALSGDPNFMGIEFKENTYTPYEPPNTTGYFASDVDPQYNSSDAPSNVLSQIQMQPFTYENSPGVVFSYPEKYTTGLEDNYALYWNDNGRELQIDITAPLGAYSAQQAIAILQTMQHYGSIPPLPSSPRSTALNVATSTGTSFATATPAEVVTANIDPASLKGTATNQTIRGTAQLNLGYINVQVQDAEGPISVVPENGTWSVPVVPKLQPGSYSVMVSAPDGSVLAKGTFVVSQSNVKTTPQSSNTSAPVQNQAPVTTAEVQSGQVSATIDQDSLNTSSLTPTISGTAKGVTGLYFQIYQGVYSGSGSATVIWGAGLIPVQNGMWSVAVPPNHLSAGTYTVQVAYDDLDALGTLNVNPQ